MLNRPVQFMPTDVATALAAGGLQHEYDSRPAYQRNDYLAWVGWARSAATRSRRIAQMSAELSEGGVYMGMVHPPSHKS